MPQGSRKSRTLRRVFRRTPGSQTVLRYEKRKPSAAKCGGCGNALKGVPKARPHAVRALPKTARRPERTYGGVLCSSCTRRTLVAKSRVSQ